MGEPRNRYLDLVDFEGPSRAQGSLELEAAHRQRQVHVRALTVARPGKGAPLDNDLRECVVPWNVEQLVPHEQFEPLVLADSPRREQILRIRGQKEVAVEGREHLASRRCVVVRAPHTDDQIANPRC